MADVICHHDGRYNLYCTISDGFVYERGLSLEQLKAALRRRSGGLSRLPERLARAHERGHSSLVDEDLYSFLCCNRAGENEAHLPVEECIQRFLSGLPINKKTGLTDGEQRVMDALLSAFNEFSKLDRQHPDEARDFTDSIHRLQDILAVRIARREYPTGWPTYDDDN